MALYLGSDKIQNVAVKFEGSIVTDPPSYQSKTVDPSSSAQTITADDGYDALEKVTINAIPNNYVGSAITRQNSNSLTVNDVTVTVPAGYYASAATKTISVNHYYTGSSTPSSSLGSNGDIYLQIGG